MTSRDQSENALDSSGWEYSGQHGGDGLDGDRVRSPPGDPARTPVAAAERAHSAYHPRWRYRWSASAGATPGFGYVGKPTSISTRSAADRRLHNGRPTPPGRGAVSCPRHGNHRRRADVGLPARQEAPHRDRRARPAVSPVRPAPLLPPSQLPRRDRYVVGLLPVRRRRLRPSGCTGPPSAALASPCRLQVPGLPGPTRRQRRR